MSGVSWLHDTLLQRTRDRREELKNKLADGVEDLSTYNKYVGRCQELKRLIDTDIPELFKDFYSSDTEEDGLDEL